MTEACAQQPAAAIAERPGGVSVTAPMLVVCEPRVKVPAKEHVDTAGISVQNVGVELVACVSRFACNFACSGTTCHNKSFAPNAKIGGA